MLNLLILLPTVTVIILVERRQEIQLSNLQNDAGNEGDTESMV